MLEAVAAADAYRFVVERTGPPLVFDVVPGLGVSRIEGLFERPDRVAADVAGSFGPLAVTLPLVQVGADLWIRMPFGGGWERWAVDELVDVAGLVGDVAFMEQVVEDVSVLEVAADRTSGRIDTTTLAAAAEGVVGGGTADLEVTAVGGVVWLAFVDPVDPSVSWRIGLGPVEVGGRVDPPEG
jgi:hypothetical protein